MELIVGLALSEDGEDIMLYMSCGRLTHESATDHIYTVAEVGDR